MKLSDLCDLLCIPNATTAASDILAAGVLASGGRVPTDGALARWGAAMVASVCLYTAGMALNDAADAPRDLRERPERPIPSGRVSRRFAATLAAALAAAGLAAAGRAGVAPLGCAAALTLAIVTYDLRLAGRAGLGPTGMAACRALNFTMGLLVFGPPAAAGWLAVVLLAGYVFGVTHLSLGETGGGARGAVGVAAVIAALACLGVVGLAAAHGAAHGAVHTAVRWGAVAAPVVILALLAGRALRAAWRDPRPGTVGPAVGTMVSGILWLDAGIAMTAGAPVWLAAFLLLASAQTWLRRSFRVT